MCSVSEKLKLCNCSDVDFDQAEYWVLFRWEKRKHNYIVGETYVPLNIFLPQEQEQNNQSILLNLLNDRHCFDFAHSPKYKDRLAIFIKPDLKQTPHNAATKNEPVYGFEYRSGQWHPCEYSFLTWEWKHNTFQTGNAINAITTTPY
ncbi:MAG: hypothetical protein EOO43_00880 [Flavobacterium sp.]|nr:MAG: hypothetical protein EOO43_00880 [Flavobacterium sp.]